MNNAVTLENLENYLINNQKTWLITGVGGFIGSNLLELLLKLNQKIVGIDNFSTGFKQNIENVLQQLPLNVQQNFKLLEADITSSAACEKAVCEVDYVLHQAALGSVPRSIENPPATNLHNVTGFLNILTAAKNAKVKRFVYASSSSVYGDSPILPKVEENTGNLLSPYAVSKATNELYAKAFSLCYGIETIGLRYFNVFGPRQSPKGPYAAVIPLWIDAMQNEKDIYINGDGTTSRDFCYVQNVLQANLLAALTTHPQAVNRVYNIAVGEQTTLNELFTILKDIIKPSQAQKIYNEFRKGDIKHSHADISLAKNLLGYAPRYNVVDGLIQTIKCCGLFDIQPA
jgi:UDP-N-acetylglucosamine 4-epimerase